MDLDATGSEGQTSLMSEKTACCDRVSVI